MQMSKMVAWSCDAITGQKIDVFPVSAASYNRLLSAGGEGSVTIPIRAEHTRAERRAAFSRWERIIVLEDDGQIRYGGYAIGGERQIGAGTFEVKLQDAWTMFQRRGGWDRAAPITAQWSASVSGTRGVQAWRAIERGTVSGGQEKTRMPLSLVSSGGGSSVTRKYFGYNFEYISDVLSGLLDEGLDIYLEPRWVNDRFDWGFRAGMAWGSGNVHEFAPLAAQPRITNLRETDDGARVTNNAGRLGEGSEVDMLGRSRQNFDSPYPILDRITPAKTISDPLQLEQMALADLALYGSPTVQWDLEVLASEGVDVGDTIYLPIFGDPWIEDGRHERRVVKVSGTTGPFVTVGMQPVGGA